MSLHAQRPVSSAHLPIPGEVDFAAASPAAPRRSSGDAVLELNDVMKQYAEPAGGMLTVLKGVSLSVTSGETLAIIGPSGSGKTTLLGLCAGLDRPSSGRLTLAGRDLAAMNEDERARVRAEQVGFVFQNFQLVPTLTALENVMVPAELIGRSGHHVEAEARDWLQRVGLGDRVEHYPVQLSGGEQQRVALARAFMNRPRILFADEPTGNLDEETAARIEGLLFDLNTASGTTLVIVTHNPDLAKRCRRIIRMRDGVASEDPEGRTSAG